MMAERGISIARATIHRWIVRCSAGLLKGFRRRNLSAAKQFLREALKPHGIRAQIVIGGCGTCREVIRSRDYYRPALDGS